MEIRNELKEHYLKYTKQRHSILSVLKESKTPLTINQIIEKTNIEMDLSTIYRVLDVFEEKKLINKTVPLEPSLTVYDYNRDIHKHHLTCVECSKILVIDSCPLEEYESQIGKETGFVIKRHQLELYGLCPKCQLEASENVK